MKPLMKYPGGKTQLLGEIEPLIKSLMKEGSTYCEPFVGGGAVLFDMMPEKAVISDKNEALIDAYMAVKECPDELIECLKEHQREHSPEWYYMIRGLDRDHHLKDLSLAARGARAIYLSRTCFNGLWRVNSKGQFNVALGRTSSGKAPDIVQEPLIREMHEYLKGVEILCGSYENAIGRLKASDVCYMDPPYTYDGAGFQGYQKEGWPLSSLLELRDRANMLVNAGVSVVISNQDSEPVREAFKDWDMKEVKARRNINRDGQGRGPVGELLIYKKGRTLDTTYLSEAEYHHDAREDFAENS